MIVFLCRTAEVERRLAGRLKCLLGEPLDKRHTQPVASCAVGDGVVLAHRSAVEAHHAARCVHEVGRQVNAVRLAHVHAVVAVGAEVGVDVHVQS